MKTRSGQTVKSVQRVGNQLVGIVEGDICKWELDGRRTSKRRSKLDLVLERPRYVAIRKWGDALSARLYDNKPKGKGIVKLIEVVL